MIDFKNKIIFIHIPKTGGTSIESAFPEKDVIQPLHDDIINIKKVVESKPNSCRPRQYHYTELYCKESMLNVAEIMQKDIKEFGYIFK